MRKSECVVWLVCDDTWQLVLIFLRAGCNVIGCAFPAENTVSTSPLYVDAPPHRVWICRRGFFRKVTEGTLYLCGYYIAYIGSLIYE